MEQVVHVMKAITISVVANVTPNQTITEEQEDFQDVIEDNNQEF